MANSEGIDAIGLKTDYWAVPSSYPITDLFGVEDNYCIRPSLDQADAI
jgi:hypothetical protein